MRILDCSACQAAGSCRLEQQARNEPCPSIDPMHCGLTMRLSGSGIAAAGPVLEYACTRCKERVRAYTVRPPPKAPPRSFADPILPTVTDGDIPDTLE